MNLRLERLTADNDSTIGVLFVDGRFVCFTVEDEFRATKIAAETRIPAGVYDIKLRAVGGFHDRFLAKFGASWHRGMLHLQNVPGFEYILIHTGNTDDDSEGCLIVGLGALTTRDGGGNLTGSVDAYQKLYPLVRDALLRGERVTITIVDRDRQPERLAA